MIFLTEIIKIHICRIEFYNFNRNYRKYYQCFILGAIKRNLQINHEIINHRFIYKININYPEVILTYAQIFTLPKYCYILEYKNNEFHFSNNNQFN